jgi:membrane protease YdiL (CAAX protease family)
LQESVGGVLGYVEDWTSHGFATKICAPIFEELVYRVGIQQALQYTLDSLMTTAGVPDSVASTVSKVASVHLTAYLFALSHGPVQTQEGALRYLRAIVRGSAFELANTPLNGFLGITLSHMAYNALR